MPWRRRLGGENIAGVDPKKGGLPGCFIHERIVGGSVFLGMECNWQVGPPLGELRLRYCESTDQTPWQCDVRCWRKVSCNLELQIGNRTRAAETFIQETLY